MLALRPHDIEVAERHRALCNDAVERLAKSMADIGLRQPITVRVVDEMEVDGELTAGVPVLVAGAHRLAAAKRLGWDKIDCIEVADDPVEAELWEIAENLHRLDLSKEQRDEHIRRYAELIEKRLQSRPEGPIESARDDKRGHRPKGTVAIVAEDLGISKKVARAAIHPKPQLVDVVDAYDAIARQADAIVRAWNRACPDARDLALQQIDGPVFDNTRAA